MGTCSPGAILSQSVERKLTSLVTQTVKNLPAVQETWVWSLGGEDPLEKAMATHSSILAWKIPMDRGAWQATAHEVTKSLTGLGDWHFHFHGKREQSFLNYAFISSLAYTPLLISLPETTVWSTEAGALRKSLGQVDANEVLTVRVVGLGGDGPGKVFEVQRSLNMCSICGKGQIPSTNLEWLWFFY